MSTERGPRPLAMRSEDDRGPAYTAAVEGAEAAFRHAREALGRPRGIDTAGYLADLAAALPREMPVMVEDRIWDGTGAADEAAYATVVATIAATAGQPETPVRDDRGREYDVMSPALELGTWLLPTRDVPEQRPARAAGPYARLTEAIDTGAAGPGEMLTAAREVLIEVAELLAREDGPGPAAFLAAGSPISAAIATRLVRLRAIAVQLAELAPAADHEEQN